MSFFVPVPGSFTHRLIPTSREKSPSENNGRPLLCPLLSLGFGAAVSWDSLGTLFGAGHFPAGCNSLHSGTGRCMRPRYHVRIVCGHELSARSPATGVQSDGKRGNALSPSSLIRSRDGLFLHPSSQRAIPRHDVKRFRGKAWCNRIARDVALHLSRKGVLGDAMPFPILLPKRYPLTPTR